MFFHFVLFFKQIFCIRRLSLYFPQFLEWQFQDQGKWFLTAFICSAGETWLSFKPMKAHSGVLPFSLLTAQTVLTEILGSNHFVSNLYFMSRLVSQRKFFKPVQELIAGLCHTFSTFNRLVNKYIWEKKKNKSVNTVDSFGFISLKCHIWI